MAQADDPAYAAYLRSLGFDQDLAQKDAARQRLMASGQVAITRPEVLAQGEDQRDQISGSWEDRGMWGSSGRLRALGDQRRDETYQLALLDKGLADTTSNIDMSLARELAAINKNRVNAKIAHDAASAQAAAGGDPMTRALQLIAIGKGGGV